MPVLFWFVAMLYFVEIFPLCRLLLFLLSGLNDCKCLMSLMIRESLRIKREFERLGKSLKRVSKSKQDNFVQFGALLARIGIQRKDYDPKLKIQPLAVWVQQQAVANPEMVRIPDWLSYNENQMNIKRLTLSQYQDVVNSLKNIRQLDRFGVDSDRMHVVSDGGSASETAASLDGSWRLEQRKWATPLSLFPSYIILAFFSIYLVNIYFGSFCIGQFLLGWSYKLERSGPFERSIFENNYLTIIGNMGLVFVLISIIYFVYHLWNGLY